MDGMTVYDMQDRRCDGQVACPALLIQVKNLTKLRGGTHTQSTALRGVRRHTPDRGNECHRVAQIGVVFGRLPLGLRAPAGCGMASPGELGSQGTCGVSRNHQDKHFHPTINVKTYRKMVIGLSERGKASPCCCSSG